MKEHVLVILPHPDDESYGVAGLIALHRQKRYSRYVCMRNAWRNGAEHGRPFFREP